MMDEKETLKWIEAELCNLFIKRRWLESARNILKKKQEDEE